MDCSWRRWNKAKGACAIRFQKFLLCMGYPQADLIGLLFFTVNWFFKPCIIEMIA